MTEQYKLEFRASRINEGDKAIIISHGDKTGFFSILSCKFIGHKYDGTGHFHDGRSRVWLNGKVGFMDYNGDEVIPLKYDWAWRFQDGYAPVRLNGKEGYVDINGKVTWDN